jgi:hypothetical protein
VAVQVVEPLVGVQDLFPVVVEFLVKVIAVVLEVALTTMALAEVALELWGQITALLRELR